MKAVVIYESMYGHTHQIAKAIGEGLGVTAEVAVVPVSEADADLVKSADVVVVGGPTHAHGMSRASTRKAAADAAAKPGADLVFSPDAADPGLREWFASLDRVFTNAAAFDTRIDLPAAVTGRASKGIARKLRHHGATLIAAPESFLVKKDSHLAPDQELRAREWGAQLARSLKGNVRVSH